MLKWICLHTKFVHAEIWNVGPADHPSGNGVTGPNDLAGDDRESVAASSVRDRSHHSLARESSERSVEMSIDEEFERALSAEGHPHWRCWRCLACSLLLNLLCVTGVKMATYTTGSRMLRTREVR